MPSPKRLLKAIMFTDIVGYTALMGRDSSKALELVRKSKEIQKPLVEKHNGNWIKEMGDGALASFESALDAVNCAWDIQRASRADFAGDLRIGIHSGDITIEDNDVYGDGVNVAARLESIADPGGIYISESIEKAIRGQTDKQARFLGGIELKNVDYEVRTYALQGVGLPLPDLKSKKQLSGTHLAELKRRGIIRSGVVYILLSVLLFLFIPYLNSWMALPEWINTAVNAFLIAGFLLALYLAWRFERSPEGFVQTKSPKSWQNPYPATKRKPLTNNLIIAGLVALILVVYFYPKFSSGDRGSGVTKTFDNSAEIEKTLAVLPFVNDSPEEENEYFCNGMMDEILSHLQKIADLGVKSRTDVEKYRNATQSIASIANELDVAYVLEGAVRKYGNRFRVTTQLIDAGSGNHLWAETYDGTFSDTIFVVQTDIAKRVASALQAVITPGEQERIEQLPTSDIAAYDLYIKARHEWTSYFGDHDRKHFGRAHALLNDALQIDPDFVSAMEVKSWVFVAEGEYDSVAKYNNKVIALEPESYRSYKIKAFQFQRSGDMDLAIEYFQKALSLPSTGEDWYWSYIELASIYYWSKNDIVSALPYFQKAIESGKYLAAANNRLAVAFQNVGDYKRAQLHFKKGFKIEVHCWDIFTYNNALLADGKIPEVFQFTDSICQAMECKDVCYGEYVRFYALKGDFKRAESYFNLSQNPPFRIKIWMSYVYAELGDKEKAEANTEELIDFILAGDRGTESDLFLSRLYAYQGKKKEALLHLSKYAEKGFIWGWHDFILFDPMFENLREDPEFLEIVRKEQERKAAVRAQIREMEENGELDWLEE